MVSEVPDSKVGAAQSPYPPSWIDRLIVKVESLTLPAWLIYGMAMAAAIPVLNAVFWLDGALAPGSFDALISGFGVWIFFWIAFYHYLTRVGSESLQTFRPLLKVDETEYQVLERELTTLPSWIGWAALPLGFGLAVILVLGTPARHGELIPQTVVPRLIDFLLSGFMTATFFALVIRSLRQLRMVSRLHRRATQFDVLDLEPAHAFSNLTARTGAVLVFVAVVGTIMSTITTGSAAFSPVDGFLTVVVLVLAGAAFFLPVMGMQGNLVREKNRELRRVHQLLNTVRSKLHDDIREHEYKDMADRDAALEALLRERELLEQVSTWPWEPRTLRGFASTLLLPIFVWVVTRILERFV